MHFNFPSTTVIPVVPGSPSGDKPITANQMEALLLGMEHRLRAKTDKNSDHIKTLEQRMDASDSQLDDRIRKIVREEQGQPAQTSGLGDSSLYTKANYAHSGRHLDDYLEARRSLRMWPVRGPDLASGLETFLRDKLGFDAAFIASLGDVKVRKHIDPRSKNQDEVVVAFLSVESRDAVKAAGPKLAGEGRAAGLRLQIPSFLSNNFRLLENLGYQMRKMDQDVRRVVKFDDENQDLMMDVRIGGEWRRVYPSDARAAPNHNPNLSFGPAAMTSANISDFFTRTTPATGANRQQPRQ